MIFSDGSITFGRMILDEDEAQEIIEESSNWVTLDKDLYVYTPTIGHSIIVEGTNVRAVVSDSIGGYIHVDQNMFDRMPEPEVHLIFSDIPTSSRDIGHSMDVDTTLWAIPSMDPTWFGVPREGGDPLYWYGLDDPYDRIGDDEYQIYIKDECTLSLEDGQTKFRVKGPIMNVWQDDIPGHIRKNRILPSFSRSFHDMEIWTD